MAAEDLRPVAAAPVVVAGATRGVLYGSPREHRDLDHRVTEVVRAAAHDVARTIALRDERDRQPSLVAVAARRSSRDGDAHRATVQPTEAQRGGRRRSAPGAGESQVTESQVTESQVAESQVADSQVTESQPVDGPLVEAELEQLHAELRSIAQSVQDSGLRARLRDACAQLARLGTTTAKAPAEHPSLTPREIDVLTYVALGRTNAETARMLYLTPETVKSYLREAMRKLDARTRLEAAVSARRLGILP